jgi:hypothetical protein
LAIFEIAIKYRGVSAEDIVKFDAASPSVAKKKCEEVLSQNKEFVERLERSGVYTSKVMESCRLCRYDYTLDVLGCAAILNTAKDSENNI